MYSCDVTFNGSVFPLAGEVVFTLETKETTVQKCPPGSEFCPDLVISKNSGKLQGAVMLILGFETMLDGALDCSTGNFRATAVDGRWGLPVPVDPSNWDGPWSVPDPFGTFAGTLTGSYTNKSGAESIEGSWMLHEMSMDVDCNGPFSVTLQP